MSSLISTITEALNSLPEIRLVRVEMDPQAIDKGADAEIMIEVQGHLISLLLDEKKSAYPRDVRAAAWQLTSAGPRVSSCPAVPMLIASSLPRSSREYLRQQKIAYADSGGSLYLPLPQALFYVDKPVPRQAPREARNIYKGNTTRVLHLLLSQPQRAWHVSDLAKEAGVSRSTVHQVFQVLENQLWMEGQGKGPELVRTLTEPGSLLNAWREEHSLKQYEARSFYCYAKSEAMLRHAVTAALEHANRDYALTSSSGAELVAPFVTNVERVSVLIPQGLPLDGVIQEAKLEPVEEGSNVTFLLSKGDAPLLLRRQLDGVSVASDVQLYLDLWASPARGKEQAEHLRRERLSF